MPVCFSMSTIAKHITNFMQAFQKTINKLTKAQFNELVRCHVPFLAQGMSVIGIVIGKERNRVGGGGGGGYISSFMNE